MVLYDKKGEIRYLNKLSDDIYHLGIKCPEISKNCHPGQFVMIRVSENYDPLLRRPFSILRTISEEGIIEIIFKVVGKGTKILSEKRKWDVLDVLGPLGRGFNFSDGSKNYILIGGGIGFPPLFFMIDFLKNEKKDIIFYYGAKRKEEIFFKMELQKVCAKLVLTTEDGSSGEKGLISDVFIKDLDAGILQSDSEVFSCGPNPMLERISSICERRDLKLQVSLENIMACGTGLCQGCAVKIKKSKDDFEYKLVCKDGPVFDSNIILWEG